MLVGNIFNALFERTLAVDKLLTDLEKLWKVRGGAIKNNDTIEQKGFNLGLNENQLTVLHALLIENDFIKGDCKDFINAFTGRQIVNKLEWIDKAQKVNYVTIQTLFQLLHSCNIELINENNVIKKEVKVALNAIFSNSWGNINSKFNEFNPLKTNRQKDISSIINNLKS